MESARITLISSTRHPPPLEPRDASGTEYLTRPPHGLEIMGAAFTVLAAMKVIRSGDGGLTIVDFPVLIGVIGFPLSAALVVVAVVTLSRQGARSVQGWVTAALAAMFFVIAASFTKRSEFHFDPLTRELRWSRRGIFTRASGAVPLERIRAAEVQAITSGEGSDTYRVVLETPDGILAVTEYGSINHKRHTEVRDMIQQALNATRADGRTESIPD